MPTMDLVELPISPLHPSEDAAYRETYRAEAARRHSELPALDADAHSQRIDGARQVVTALQVESAAIGGQIRECILTRNGEGLADLKGRQRALPVLIAIAEMGELQARQALQCAEADTAKQRRQAFAVLVSEQEAAARLAMEEAGKQRRPAQAEEGRQAGIVYHKAYLKYRAYHTELHGMKIPDVEGIARAISEKEQQVESLLQQLVDAR